MRAFFNFFLDLLEKASFWLEKTTGPMERRMAYFFCILKILTTILAEAVAVGFFAVQFQKPVSWDILAVMILSFGFLSLLFGYHIYIIIAKDLKHLRETDPKKKKNPLKDNKIEF